MKRIWTSSYTLYSGGLILLILAGFYAAIELRGWKRWSFPLMVIGANSIAIYVMSWTMEHFVSESLATHLGNAPFLLLGPPFEPACSGAWPCCSSSGGSSTGCTGRRSSSRSERPDSAGAVTGARASGSPGLLAGPSPS